MTSKRKQFAKTPISIFFSDDQVPKKFKDTSFEEFDSYSVLKTEGAILINLKKISNLNTLQKNHRLLLIGLAIRKYIKSGDFFIDYFGCKKTDITNFFLGSYLADYSFDKCKSKKKTKKLRSLPSLYPYFGYNIGNDADHHSDMGDFGGDGGGE